MRPIRARARGLLDVPHEGDRWSTRTDAFVVALLLVNIAAFTFAVASDAGVPERHGRTRFLIEFASFFLFAPSTVVGSRRVSNGTDRRILGEPAFATRCAPR